MPGVNLGLRTGARESGLGLRALNSPIIREAPVNILPSSNPNGTSFVVDASGQSFPVPTGSTGPTIIPNGNGVIYAGGKGGGNRQVGTMRVMSPVPAKGKSPGYPNGYIKYENNAGQGVNPYFGQTGSKAATHFPLN